MYVIGSRMNNNAFLNYNKRIEWIDACKGILILLMVWGHVPNISAGHII